MLAWAEVRVATGVERSEMVQSAAHGREVRVNSLPDEWPQWYRNDPRWQTAQRVVASRHFVRSRLLARFLLHIVSETIEDRKANITEHRIGVLVFDRSSSYSSIQDNIVRTYARQLRRRLADYFAEEGAGEPLHIDIPLGGYAPVFTPTLSSESAAEEPEARVASEEDAPAAPSIPLRSFRVKVQPLRWKRKVIFASVIAIYSLALITGSCLVARRVAATHRVVPNSGSANPLWTALFSGPANCYIVPADAGFNILEDLSHHSLPLALYVQGSYATLPLSHIDEHSAEDLHSQQFTSFTDLQIVTALARLPEYDPQRAILKFPRQLQLDDLKDSNAIILGSMSSNPWAEIAEKSANFRIVNGEAMQAAMIVNTKPEAGESATYMSRWAEPAHETYAIIAYLPNLDGNGHVLQLQGLDVAGTQAAAEALMYSAAVASILNRATRPDGSLRTFEILLRSSSIESKSVGTTVIGSRIY